VSLANGRDGSPINFISQIQDISERRANEHILAEERRRLRAAQSIGRIGSWEVEIATGNVTWSDTLFELYGLDPGDFGGDEQSSLIYIHPDDAAGVQAALDECRTSGTPMWNRHRVYRVNDGEPRWFDTRAERHQENGLLRIVGLTVDVTDQIQSQALLEHAALHDPLTGLPNRRLIIDRLSRALNRSERQGQVAVLFCDLDGFKMVNDRHGHNAGDAVLIETAARIMESIRSGDTAGRMGGDEFVVICGVPPGEDPVALGALIAQRIERTMARPIAVDDLEYRVTISTGVCLAGQGDNADFVLRNADEAMYRVKSQSRDGYALKD
jgi:diguanylate cyclase (GGDEF)-like protein/PAS domain S-box-containing protein